VCVCVRVCGPRGCCVLSRLLCEIIPVCVREEGVP